MAKQDLKNEIADANLGKRSLTQYVERQIERRGIEGLESLKDFRNRTPKSFRQQCRMARLLVNEDPFRHCVKWLCFGVMFFVGNVLAFDYVDGLRERVLSSPSLNAVHATLFTCGFLFCFGKAVLSGAVVSPRDSWVYEYVDADLEERILDGEERL